MRDCVEHEHKVRESTCFFVWTRNDKLCILLLIYINILYLKETSLILYFKGAAVTIWLYRKLLQMQKDKSCKSTYESSWWISINFPNGFYFLQ